MVTIQLIIMEISGQVIYIDRALYGMRRTRLSIVIAQSEMIFLCSENSRKCVDARTLSKELNSDLRHFYLAFCAFSIIGNIFSKLIYAFVNYHSIFITNYDSSYPHPFINSSFMFMIIKDLSIFHFQFFSDTLKDFSWEWRDTRVMNPTH